MSKLRLSLGELLELKRWNTPTIYNGWEQITGADPARDCFNLEEVRDFMPQMGPMVGYAVTVVCKPSEPEYSKANPDGWSEYRQYIAAEPGPKIVVVQDLDKPRMIGAWWGEVNSTTHKALGCVGSITDGAIRDVDEVAGVGFKLLARGTCVGHAHCWPVRWGCEVEVFGRRILPGQLIHADQHGFLAIPKGDETKVLEAARFMDTNECTTVIPAARDSAGKTSEEILRNIDEAEKAFRAAVRKKFERQGEW